MLLLRAANVYLGISTSGESALITDTVLPEELITPKSPARAVGGERDLGDSMAIATVHGLKKRRRPWSLTLQLRPGLVD
jgi:hypothetical protein